ncbi:DUF2339 domain-containing protein [Nocardia sp. X0981]
MTTSIDPALVARLSGEFTTLAGEFTALGSQMNALGRDLDTLHRNVRGADGAREPLADAGGEPVTGPGPVRHGTPRPDARAEKDRDTPASETAAAERGESAEKPTPERTPPSFAGTDTEAEPGVRGGGVRAPGPADPAAAPGATGSARPEWDIAARAPGGPPHPAAWGAPRAQIPPPRPWYPAGAPAGYPPGAVPPPPPPGGPGFRTGRPVPAGPRTPWWQREGVISRVLAVAGVAVTLIGVVMLLVLAAQAGVFGPVPRVVAGAAFSAALVGAGMRVYHRSGGRVGGVALAATGFAGAYLDVIAVTTIYDWLHPVPGFAVALGVAATGVGLAVQWRSQALAVLVVAGAAVLAPFVTVQLPLLAFLIILQLACVPVQYRHDWPLLHVVRTVPAVLATQLAIVVAVWETPHTGRALQVLAAAVAVAAIGLVGTVLIVRKRPGDLVATLSFALSTTPLLAAPALFDRPGSTVLAAVYAAVLLTVALTPLLPAVRGTVRIPGHTATVAAVAGSFALLEACWGVTTGATLPLALFGVAAGYLGVAGQARNRVAALLGGGYAALGGLAFFADADPQTLAGQWRAVHELTAGTAASAAAGLGVVAVALWGSRRLTGPTADDAGMTLLWTGAGAAALYLVTAATVSLGVVSGAAEGFVIGHSIATIVWMAGALAAILYGLRTVRAGTPTTARIALGSGLLVTAAALAKLFLFDLATLDGLVRVAAFLVVGILLLVAGTRYARAFAETGAGTTAPAGGPDEDGVPPTTEKR